MVHHLRACRDQRRFVDGAPVARSPAPIANSVEEGILIRLRNGTQHERKRTLGRFLPCSACQKGRVFVGAIRGSVRSRKRRWYCCSSFIFPHLNPMFGIRRQPCGTWQPQETGRYRVLDVGIRLRPQNWGRINTLTRRTNNST